MKTTYAGEKVAEKKIESMITAAQRWRSGAAGQRKEARNMMRPARGRALKEEATRKSVWGIAASIDIYNCNPATIRDADAIRRFVVELSELIEMKRFGETQIVNFGEDERVAGYSMVQLIETSLISAHFANQSNAAYLDVFSCKPYDPFLAEKFALKFFGGTHCLTKVNLRK
jgi:S-adenosylmethionine/arginine decarboxylase-like enzyme